MRFHQKWEARAVKPDNSETEWFEAAVPGNVQKDYLKYINSGDIMYSDNSEILRQTENFTWELRCFAEFDIGENERAFFVAEGIDYSYAVYINGEKAYESEGMYTPVSLELMSQIDDGRKTEIKVVIYPHPKNGPGEKDTRDEASYSCKPPFCYGWDWNPRLLISGMWLNSYIETRDEYFIESCEPFYALDVNTRTAKVHFETECKDEVLYTLKDADSRTVYESKNSEFTLNDVNLWWCAGQGKPYLYTWTAKSRTDEKEGKIGFKTLRLVKNEGAQILTEFPKSRYHAPITIELNGRRIFAKGSNYVNSELFVGNTSDETLIETVKSAYEANMNIIRVWGGSGITKDAFYSACDKYGILVWQEFMLACNNYPDDKHYLEVLNREARSIIKKLRSHACLAFWCGGNELFNDWSGMDDQSKPLRLLNSICYELDESRPFMMTSPIAGMGHGGYLFRYDDGKDVFEVFNNSKCTAYSEFGVPSISSIENLEKIIPPKELESLSPTKSWVHHHAFGAWGESRWSCPETLEYYFGEVGNVETAVERTQKMQAVGCKGAFEEARRQWPYCSMAINWCFNEPWITAANNSLMEYPLKKKPAYYAVRDSLKNVLASARIPKFDFKEGEIFSSEIWLLNDSNTAVRRKITVYLTVGDKTYELLTWDSGEVKERTNKIGPTVRMTLPESDSDEIILTLKTDAGEENSYTLLLRHKNREKTKKILNM